MMTPAVGTGRPADDGGPGQRRGLPRGAWLALGPLAALASKLIAGPTIELITTICGVAVPAALGVVLFFVALFGSDSQQDRAYRLLRWLKDKPEPPGPPKPPPPRPPKAAKRSRRARGRTPHRKR